MKNAKLTFFIFCVFAFCAGGVRAQYYSWGSDAPMRWQSLRGDDVRVVFPDTAARVAHRALHYLDAVRPDIDHGFRLPPLKISVVVHPENFQSNGLVMWMPKRIEFLSTPAADSYSMPWVKQLAAHEYRHAVQYNNLDRGIIRVLSRLLGQQGSVVGIPFMYLWILEGDAVMTETEMSSFGRGRQPRFSLEYRALGREVLGRRNVDRWFSGSYREFVPDHYQQGYQMVHYAYDRYGEEIWDKTLRYAVRNAYMLTFSTGVALRKYYDTHEKKLYTDTFTDLNRHWDSLPAAEDSGVTLTPLPAKNYTTYSHPMPRGTGWLIALKSDFDDPSRFVVIDKYIGKEWPLLHTGAVSSRPATDGGSIWWTEYRRSLLFPQRVDSRIVRLEPGARRAKTVRGIRGALYPTPTGDGLAWVRYTPDGTYTVRTAEAAFAMPPFAEVHGMAWDEQTERLYVLVTDDSGMWIGRIDPEEGLQPITEGAYITLSDLRAADGKLYFGSIASGRDEAHCFDLAEGRQYRISSSTYGSFSPAPDNSGKVWTTTYDRRGYRITRQSAGNAVPVETSLLPVDLNPPRKRWEVVNLDTVRYDPALHDPAQPASRRYRRGANLFDIHSWAPVSFDPFGLIEEFAPDPMLGATILSQNLLSNMEGYASWGWNRRDGHIVKGEIRYSGLGVRLEAGAFYGGERLVYGRVEGWPVPPPANYWSVHAGATLPLYFDRGYHVRQLTVSTGYDYSNGKVLDVGALRFDGEGGIMNREPAGYRDGVHKLAFGIGYSDVVRAAYRDVATPWGYLLFAGYDMNPENRDFSDLVSGYARLYTPGFARNNSLVLSAAYQTSVGGYRFPDGGRWLGYRSSRLIPRGFSTADISNVDYMAAAVDYHFPLCYPEGGIPGFLYFKRIRMNAGGQYARFREEGGWRRLYAYGVDLFLDTNVLRSPASSTWTVKLSLYKPNRRGLWFGFGFEAPL